MKLKEKIDYSEFFGSVQSCRGEVCLITPEGDLLNLKSTLSQFVFAAAIRGNVKLAGAVIRLEISDDRPLLARFVTED